ncbi:MAG: hypothetical protein ACKV2T_29255 [Kofleriaceae bacterium]
MITCSDCGRTVDGEIADDTPCPQCGTPLLAGKPPEVDAAWAAEKKTKQDAAAAANAPKKRGGYWLLGIVMVVAVGAIGMMVWQRSPTLRGADVGEIEIRITAPKDGTPVVVDGAPAGKTPLILRLESSSEPIKIIGNNVAIVVVPDRSRTVELVHPKKRK